MNNVGLSRKHIVEGVNASLERLGLEYVDLIYAHRPDRNTPIEETVRAFNHIIDTGKAFYWGTSEWDADEIATAWRVADKLGLSKIFPASQFIMLKTLPLHVFPWSLRTSNANHHPQLVPSWNNQTTTSSSAKKSKKNSPTSTKKPA